MFAAGFDAHAAVNFFLLPRQGHFQGGVVLFHMAASLALGAMIKKHKQQLIFYS
jgi:hypothetical protein